MSVESIISAAQGYAASVVGDAKSAMKEAISSAGRVGYSIPNFGDVALPALPEQSISVSLPTLTTVDLTLPTAPAADLVFQDIPAVVTGVAPAFAAQAPGIDLPATPSQLASFLPSAPSVNTSIAFPDPPTALMNPLLDAPTLVARVEPIKPTVLLPTFDGVRPTDIPSAPGDLGGTIKSAYAGAAASTMVMVNGYVDAMLAQRNPQFSAQMNRIEAQLTKYLDGGTGLAPKVENAIYERARAKNDAEARRTRDAVYAETADRGFTMPPGALNSALQQARQASADNNAKAATEIAIAQAEMEQRNLQFAVTTSTGLRTAMLNASLSYMQNLVGINGQAIDYAKSILGAVVETYNIALKAFTAKMEVYKADAQVFEVKLRGALAGIELYRAEVSALEALTRVDQSRVDVYKARIDGLQALAGLYRAQIEAVQGRANLERLKLDVFQSQVQAYGAQVQAKNAEWQGYSAAVEGQVAKVRVFGAQAEAFSAQVNGFKAGIEAQSEAVRAMATTNDSRSRNYQAQWSGYQTTVQALGEVARTKLENQRQAIVAFQAQVSLAVANAQVSSEYFRATSSVAVENARLRLSAQTQGAESQRAYGQTLAQLGTANAQAYAGLANAALSGMNALAVQTLVEG